MAEENTAAPAPGQTTSVGEDTQASQQERPADAAEAQPPPSMWNEILLYAVIIFWVWWLFGNKKRKAQKAQEKKERERRDSLQKGDELVTIGRLHGKVVAFTDATVTLKPDPKFDLCLTFDRQAIFRIMPRPGEAEEKPPQEK